MATAGHGVGVTGEDESEYIIEHDEDEAMLAEIDKELGATEDGDDFDGDGDYEDPAIAQLIDELNNEIGIEDNAAPTSSTGALSQHAADFWFPEARTCACCKGYKHGCECVKKNGFIACQDATCSVLPEHRDKKAPRSSAPQSQRHNGDDNYGAGHLRRTSSGGSGGGGRQQTCKYESMPGGCRFGTNCRFAHVLTRDGSLPSPGRRGGYQDSFDNRFSAGGGAHAPPAFGFQGAPGPYGVPHDPYRGVPPAGSLPHAYPPAFPAPGPGMNNLPRGAGPYPPQSPSQPYFVAPPGNPTSPSHHGGPPHPAIPSPPQFPPSSAVPTSPHNASASPAGASAGTPPGRQVCQFFRIGQCRFGSNCRNIHE